jgi:hypothetical protein
MGTKENQGDTVHAVSPYYGDLSKGAEVRLGRTAVHDPNPKNSTKTIGGDNLRGKPWDPTKPTRLPDPSA